MSDSLKLLFRQHFRCEPTDIRTLQAHASDRKIYRLLGPEGQTACGIENPNIKENRAFIYFARHFRSKNLPVPEIFQVSQDELSYLQEDLGDVTLFNELGSVRTSVDPFPEVIEKRYEQILSILPKFQIESLPGLDFTNCYPTSIFDPKAMLWDMNYCKEKFLDKIEISYNVTKLQSEFNELSVILSRTDSGFFMYRDFQSRNIMFLNNEPYFIDFQSGRKGPLQYDLVSLLYQASAEIPEVTRQKLIKHYIAEAKRFTTIDIDRFFEELHGFVLLRILQVLGTYGVQGLEGKKPYFLNSIPRAVGNLSALMIRARELFVKFPELSSICTRLPEHVFKKGFI
jgi:aminoglycoside/choline kinase family phosphotransferase